MSNATGQAQRTEANHAGPARGTPDAEARHGVGEDPRAAIAERLTAVRADVSAAARASGRAPEDVTIVAISKTWGPRVVAAAAEAGQRQFGESRAQEVRGKVNSAAVARWSDIIWHFVGRLQTNKVKYVVGTCALVHSVDRWELAKALNDRAGFAGTTQRVLVQVNTDDDPSKAGLVPAALPRFLERMTALEHVRVEGLMTIPSLVGDPAPAFARLRALRDRSRVEHGSVTDLSMGMSRDYESAIREGATLVRIGEAIFGPRTT